MGIVIVKIALLPPYNPLSGSENQILAPKKNL